MGDWHGFSKGFCGELVSWSESERKGMEDRGLI